MDKILLPLVIVAAILFAPLYSVTQNDSVLGESAPSMKSGYVFVEPTVKCWQAGAYSMKDECEPKGGIKGKALFAALIVSAAAAALAVPGLLPFIGRVTSVGTILAGVISVAALGYFAMTMLGADKGAETLQWGTYLAGGAGLLTLISGLAGLRGR